MLGNKISTNSRHNNVHIICMSSTLDSVSVSKKMVKIQPRILRPSTITFIAIFGLTASGQSYGQLTKEKETLIYTEKNIILLQKFLLSNLFICE